MKDWRNIIDTELIRLKGDVNIMKKCLSVLMAMALISTGAANFSGFSAAEAAESIPTLTVDAGDKRHEILHSATGFLYGISNENSPSSNTLTAIKPKILATKGALGTEHPYGDALDVADEFFESGGEMVMMYNNGYYGKFGVDAETSEYAEVLKNQICPAVVEYKNKVRDKYPNIDNMLVYIPINEGTPRVIEGIRQDTINDSWKAYYDAIKSADPGAVVCGPNNATYGSGYGLIDNFLEFCRDNDCLPDIITWHQLGDSGFKGIGANTESYKNICKNLGIEEKPVIINEYAWYTDCGVGGRLVNWMSRFEEAQVYGCMPFWHQANNLNDLTVGQNEGNSAWWTFKWYADMEGQSLGVSAENTAAYTGYYGLAAEDESKKEISILAGGNDGSGRIVINNLNNSDTFKNASKLKAEVKAAYYEGINGVEYNPPTIMEGVYEVKNNSVTIDIDDMMFSASYYVVLSETDEDVSEPLKGTWRKAYEAEDADYSPSMSVEASGATAPYYYYSGNGRVGDFSESDDLLQYVIDVPVSGNYRLEFIYSNGEGSNSSNMDTHSPKNLSQNVIIDGAEPQTIMLPNTLSKNSSGRADLNTYLSAGKHTIKIMNDGKESEYYPNETIKPEIYHDLMYVSYNGAADDRVNIKYEAEDAEYNNRDEISKERTNAGFSGSGYVTGVNKSDVTDGGGIRFITDVPQSGIYKLSFRYAASEAGAINIYRGNTALTRDRFVLSEETENTNLTWKNAYAAIYLEKGINIIDVDSDCDLQLDYMRVTDNSTQPAAEVKAADGAGNFETAHSFYAGTDYVKEIKAESDEVVREEKGNYIEINADVPSAGKYEMQAYWSNDDLGGLHDISYKIIDRYAIVNVNGNSEKRYFFGNTYSDDSFNELSIPVELNEGKNVIRLYNDNSWNQYYCLNDNEYKHKPADIPLENYMPNFERFVFTPETDTADVNDEYRVNIMSTDGGYVTADKDIVQSGESVRLTILPDEFKSGSLKKLTVNGIEVKPDGDSYLAENVSEDISVKAEFEYDGSSELDINPDDYMKLKGGVFGRVESDGEIENPPSNAFDESQKSRYAAEDGGYCGLKFAAPAFIKGIKLTTTSTNVSALNGAKLQISNDGEEWTDIYTFGGYCASYPSANIIALGDMGNSAVQLLKNSVGYIRLKLESGADISDLSVYGRYDCDEVKLDLSDKEKTGTSGSSEATGAEAAFDGNIETYDDAGRRGYVQVDLGEETPLMKIAYYPRKGYAFRMDGGLFYGSNDNKTWTELCEPLSGTTEEWHSFDVNKSYRYIRYSNAVRNIDIAEIEIYRVSDDVLNYKMPSAGIRFETTPYAKITLNGSEYYSGADGIAEAETVTAKGDIFPIRYTIEKKGYKTAADSAEASGEGLVIKESLVPENGVIYSEDFKTVTGTRIDKTLDGGDVKELPDLFNIYAQYGTINVSADGKGLTIQNKGGGFRNVSFPLSVSAADYEAEIGVIFASSGDANLLLRDAENKIIGAVYRAADGTVSFGASGSYNKANAAIGVQSQVLGSVPSDTVVRIKLTADSENNSVKIQIGDKTAEVSANTQNPPASLYIGSSKGTSVSLDEILIKSVVPEKEYNPLMSFEVRDGNTYVEMTDIESCAVVGVRYDENGRLIAVKTAAAESSMDKIQNVVLNGIEANKVFAWNSLSDMQPVY